MGETAAVPGRALRDLAERSAAPAQVLVALNRLEEHDVEIAADDPAAEALVSVVAASRSLTTFILSTPAVALDVLRHLHRRRPVDPEALVEWKRAELLRIAARDLTGIDDLEATGAALARLAADVLDAACHLTSSGELAVVGMGKLGGAELNYASDVDVLLVGGGEPEARAVLDVARRCFRVDAGLRPEGRDGPLTRSLPSYQTYWDRWAQPWEFQALLKARPVAGNRSLGDAFSVAASARVWGRPFSADDIRSLRAMKARSEEETRRRGLGDREVKRGQGGIRDVEFAVQLLQLVHGRHDDALRSPTTLTALAELASAGFVDERDADALADAYRFLRAVEDRLQLVDEAQVHAVPSDRPARERLARVMGFRDDGAGSALEHFDGQLRRHQSTVRSIHERLYFRPLLEAFAGTDTRLTSEAAEERLAAFGFADADRTRHALQELTAGLTRSSRLMQQLLPLLLEWLSTSPDPDLGLLGLRSLASSATWETALVTSFRESPELARRLCTVLGTSRLLTETLRRNPDLLPMIGDDTALAPPPASLVAAAARHASDLQRFTRRRQLRIGVWDVVLDPDVAATGGALTVLADAVVGAALDELAPPIPFAVVAVGRFGGSELSYASDLDLLFVHGGTSADDAARAERTAEQLVRRLSGRTPAQRLYPVDTGLRPEGKDGPLARSLDGYRNYYARWAQTWERQALLRARPVAGDDAIASAFTAIADEFVWGTQLSAEEAREIRRMKARVERERIPPDEDPQFHLKLGRGSLSDVEWTVQLLQLQHGVRATGTMQALRTLRDAAAIDADDAAVLEEAYRFCERTRNRWYLVNGAPSDALPAAADQLARLARSLGTDAADLREGYRRVTRRARAAVERLFYGRSDPRRDDLADE